ncbi:hypothetical protein [Spirosoma lacussanchae]
MKKVSLFFSVFMPGPTKLPSTSIPNRLAKLALNWPKSVTTILKAS